MGDAVNSTDPALLSQWQPIRGPFTRWPRLSDALLALLSFALTISIWYSDQPADSPPTATPGGALLLFAIGNFALFRRRAKPLGTHGVVLIVSAIAMLSGYLTGPIFALAISLYSLGRYATDDQQSYGGLILALGLLMASEIAFSEFNSEDLFELLLPVGIWYVGRRVRARQEYLRLLRERAEQLEREKQVEADNAVVAERTRIARELHDVVAHQVSLMTVQAGAAKTVADSDPVASASAMSSVEQAGRQALDELRHLVGVLRPDGDEVAMGPQPGCADLPVLVDELRQTGMQVQFSLRGDCSNLPARIDLAIYRIVQESLTNVLKHAGPKSSVNVDVAVDHYQVEIAVLDDGVGTGELPSSGHGIRGMRERAQLLGGSLIAAPRESGGFAVIAILPLVEAAN